MHRLSFVIAGCLVLRATFPAPMAADLGGHFEPGKLTRDCTPCHAGHGVSSTPMLRDETDEMCLVCHEAGATLPGRREELGIGLGANPADIRTEFGKPVVHRGAVCAECHSAHGVPTIPRGGVDDLNVGRQKPSTKRGFSVEADLCLSCHGSRAPSPVDPHDIGLLFDPSNPSFHPVLAIGVGESPSLLPPLTADSMINCTNCHTNDDGTGPIGPHGSRVPGLLGADYNQQDGQPESEIAYALCYACHDRAILLSESALFPDHRKHISGERTSCDLCHNPHGATASRALIRFNEPTAMTGVTPSSSGRLEFVSDSPGSGACYLTCHGQDHDPKGYGPGFKSDGAPEFDDSHWSNSQPDRSLSRVPRPRARAPVRPSTRVQPTPFSD